MATQRRKAAISAVCSLCVSHPNQTSPDDTKIRAGTLFLSQGGLVSSFWRCCMYAG